MANRWEEYRAGTLTHPAIVQHDVLGNEHLVWVWDGTIIRGPFSRPDYDETAIIASVQAMIAAEEAERAAQSERDNGGEV